MIGRGEEEEGEGGRGEGEGGGRGEEEEGGGRGEEEEGYKKPKGRQNDFELHTHIHRSHNRGAERHDQYLT